jgi:hypothetical protein
MTRALDQRLESLAARLELHTVNLAEYERALQESRFHIRVDDMNRVLARASAERETVSEYSVAMARLASRLENALDSEAVRRMPRSIDLVGFEEASYLNWVLAPEGLIASTGNWINYPLVVRFDTRSSKLAWVNERVVELPHAHALLLGLAPGSEVLDIGSCESPLPMEAASLGHRVTALDPRSYPFAHPNIVSVAATVGEWRGPEKQFDLITCISAVEHFGLGSYGVHDEAEADIQAMNRMRHWLAPGGAMLLTVPYGHPKTDEFQRVYDDAGLEALTEGYVIDERHLYRRVDDTTWAPVGESGVRWEPDAPGVAVLRLRSP